MLATRPDTIVITRAFACHFDFRSRPKNYYGRYWLAGLSAVLIVFILGIQQSQTGYASWADISALSYELHTHQSDCKHD